MFLFINHGLGAPLFTLISGPVEAALNDEKDALSLRLIHLFLRSEGSRLGWERFMALSKAVETFYVPLMHSKKWKSLMDLFMIRADVAFTLRRSSKDIGYYLSRQVAEGLESLGRFAEAAAIYQDCVDVYPTEGRVEEIVSRQSNCGVAWRRDGNYELSEEAYVRALRMQSVLAPPLDISNTGTCQMICNFICMYDEWSRVDSGEDESATNTKLGYTRFIELLLIALLYTAKFRPPRGSLPETMIAEGGPANSKFLAPRLRTKRAAKSFLLSAFKAHSASDFRSLIISGKDPKIKTISFTGIDRIERNTKRDKEMAREVARQRHLDPRVCSNVGCGMEEEEGVLFKKCPCKQAYYCGKSCQVAHWKTHKNECTYRAEKKKSKK